MPKEMSNAELSRLSREGRAAYEDGKPVWPPAKEKAGGDIAAALERVASMLNQANSQQTVAILEQIRALAQAVRQLATAESKPEREEYPVYEFKVTEKDPATGRPITMVATPRRK